MPAQFTPSPDPAPASANPAATPSASQEAGAQTQAPASPLTAEQIRSLFREELEQINRSQQSQRDKAEARTNARIDQLKRDMQLTGQTLTPEAEQKAREAISKEPPDPAQPSQVPGRPAPNPAETAQPQAPASEKPVAPNPQTAAAWAVMDGEGMEIDDADPEAKLIDWTNPQTAYKTTKAAIEAKRTRTANATLPLSGGTPIDNPIAGIKDEDELWRRGSKQLRR